MKLYHSKLPATTRCAAGRRAAWSSSAGSETNVSSSQRATQRSGWRAAYRSSAASLTIPVTDWLQTPPRPLADERPPHRPSSTSTRSRSCASVPARPRPTTKSGRPAHGPCARSAQRHTRCRCAFALRMPSKMCDSVLLGEKPSVTTGQRSRGALHGHGSSAHGGSFPVETWQLRFAAITSFVQHAARPPGRAAQPVPPHRPHEGGQHAPCDRACGPGGAQPSKLRWVNMILNFQVALGAAWTATKSQPRRCECV